VVQATVGLEASAAVQLDQCRYVEAGQVLSTVVDGVVQHPSTTTTLVIMESQQLPVQEHVAANCPVAVLGYSDDAGRPVEFLKLHRGQAQADAGPALTPLRKLLRMLQGKARLVGTAVGDLR